MNEKRERPQLGEWRSYSTTAYRQPTRIRYGVTRKEWRSYTFNVTPGRGMFIGYRTVFDGVSEWIGEEEGWSYSFDHNTAREVWLFVVNGRSKPVYVFPEYVEAARE